MILTAVVLATLAAGTVAGCVWGEIALRITDRLEGYDGEDDD